MALYSVTYTKQFKKDLKHYKKKYPKVLDDIEEIIESLENGHLVGDEIPEVELPNGEEAYKVRAVNSSANKGKAGGFRIIYYAITSDYEIYLLTIYSKSDREDIHRHEVKNLIEIFT